MSITVPIRRPRVCLPVSLNRSILLKTPSSACESLPPWTTIQFDEQVDQRSGRHNRRLVTSDRSRDSHSPNVENIFIASLVLAGTCARHQSHLFFHKIPPLRTADSVVSHKITSRSYSSLSTPRRAVVAALEAIDPPDLSPVSLTKNELNDLVDIYGTSKPRQVQQIRSHPRLAPRLVLTAEEEEEDIADTKSTWLLPPEDEQHRKEIRHFRALLSGSLGRTDLGKIWEAYERLREPRLRYLRNSVIRRLFRHFSWTGSGHSQKTKSRYFTLLRDCVNQKIWVTRAEWNTAILYAGRWSEVATTKEVQSAAEIWQQMEQADVPADSTTFAILFDIAVKAGCFALADTIYQEVMQRQFPPDRYFRTSLIYYAGLRGSGDDVRQAFRDLVDAGELVDTVVMNCVIASLIRAGEPAAAEQVFQKMKQLFLAKMGVEAASNWQERRRSGRQLRRRAQLLRGEKEAHENSFFGAIFAAQTQHDAVQHVCPIAPDSKTYRLLIQYHALVSGDLRIVHSLLAEMKQAKLGVPGVVYVAIFRGFNRYGSMFQRDWNLSYLQALWAEFLNGVPPSGVAALPDSMTASDLTLVAANDEPFEASDGQAHFTAPTVIQILRAFYTCSGHEKMLDVWTEIQRVWPDMSKEARAELESFLSGVSA